MDHQESAGSGVIAEIDYPALAGIMATGKLFTVFRLHPSARYELFDRFYI